MAAVHLVLLDRHDHRNREDPLPPRLEVEEPRHHVRALDDQVGPLHRGALDEGLHAHRDGRGLLSEPDDDLVLRRRFAQDRARLERRSMQRRHELVREQGPHHLADRIGRDHPHDPQARRELRRQRRLADPRRTADQHYEGNLDRLDLAPALEVPGVPLAGEILEHAERELAQLRVRDRRDAELTQPVLDGLGHLVGAYGRQPGHHDLGRHQAFRIRQARIAIRDQDLGVLGVVRHLCVLRSPARPMVSLKAVGRSVSPSDTTARLSTKTTSAPRDIARSHATSTAAAFSSDRSTS